MQIAYKEARETRYWLRLLRVTDSIFPAQADSMIADCEELIRILVSILKSSKANRLPLLGVILSFFHSFILSLR